MFLVFEAYFLESKNSSHMDVWKRLGMRISTEEAEGKSDKKSAPEIEPIAFCPLMRRTRKLSGELKSKTGCFNEPDSGSDNSFLDYCESFMKGEGSFSS